MHGIPYPIDEPNGRTTAAVIEPANGLLNRSAVAWDPNATGFRDPVPEKRKLARPEAPEPVSDRLAFDQLLERPLRLRQLLKRAFLDHPAGLKHVDPVCLLDGG